MTTRPPARFAAALAALIAVSSAGAQVTYSLDDGTVENGVGITGTGTFDIVWLNQFPVNPAAPLITSIDVSFGSPVDTRIYNGLPVTALLYQDINGGATTDAVVVASVTGTIQNANSASLALVNFNIPDTLVVGNFLVGILARNVPAGAGFIASIDETDPDVAGRSFAGFTVGTPINENNLASLGANYGTIEGFGLPGNWVIRANAVVPEPGSLSLMGLAACGLGWHRRWAAKAKATAG